MTRVIEARYSYSIAFEVSEDKFGANVTMSDVGMELGESRGEFRKNAELL